MTSQSTIYLNLSFFFSSISSWGDSIVDHSDDEDKHKSVLSLSPVDLRRKESQRSITDGGISTPGLSRNDSSFSKLSRHDSTHSNQSYLSTPPNISRNTSLKLPSSEVSLNCSNSSSPSDNLIMLHLHCTFSVVLLQFLYFEAERRWGHEFCYVIQNDSFSTIIERTILHRLSLSHFNNL